MNHIPMQGLPAVPRVIAYNRPIELVNFGDDERDKARQAAFDAGAVSGAEIGARSMARLAPLCVVFPPLCIGLVATGAAVGAAQSAVSVVSTEEAGRLGTIFEKRATSSTLGELVSYRVPKAGEHDYPRLVVRVAAVVLVPTRDGVRFGLVAEAQGFPGPDHAWKPSLHMVPFPSRSVADWLASDGQALEADLQTALRVLSAVIVHLYLPYEGKH